MAKSITAVNVKLIANGQGMITEFKRAEAAASGAAKKIDSEMDKLARSVKKKFTGSSIGKDLLAGLGLGGGAATVFTGVNAVKGWMDDRAQAEKEHTASLERQARLNEEIYRIGMSDKERLREMRTDQEAALKKLQALEAVSGDMDHRAKIDAQKEAYKSLTLEVAKAAIAVEALDAATKKEDADSLKVMGFNANGTRSAIGMDPFKGTASRMSIPDMRAQADAFDRQLYNGPEGMTPGSPEYIKEQIRVYGQLQITLGNIRSAEERNLQVAAEYAGVIASGFEDAIFSGEKLSKVLKNLAQDLLRMVFNQAITQPIAGFITGGLSSIMGKASGGPVMGGTPYIVGERGPELFVPSASGSIVPNHAMGGGGNVYQIDARGTDEGVVQRLQMALMSLAGPGVVERRALSAHAGTLRRGGGAARALSA